MGPKFMTGVGKISSNSFRRSLRDNSRSQILVAVDFEDLLFTTGLIIVIFGNRSVISFAFLLSAKMLTQGYQLPVASINPKGSKEATWTEKNIYGKTSCCNRQVHPISVLFCVYWSSPSYDITNTLPFL